MTGQCPEKEFSLPDWITSYGVKRKVGEDMLRRFHRALCYLKDETELIDAKTGPQITKVFTPAFHDSKYSYGYSIGTYEGKSAYKFNNETSASVIVDFSDYNTVREYVDLRRTDAEIATEEGKARLPDYEETEIVEVLQHEIRSEKKVVYVETQVWDGTQWVTELVPREVEIPITHRDVYYTTEEKDVLAPIFGWPETEDITRGSNVDWRPGCKSWCKNTVILAQTFKAPYDTTVKNIYLGVKRPKGEGKPLYVGLAKVKSSGIPDVQVVDHKCPGLELSGLLEYHELEDAANGFQGEVGKLDFSTPIKKDNFYAIVIWTEEEQSADGWRILGVKDKNKIKDSSGNTIGQAWMYWNQRVGWQRLAGTRNGCGVTGSICFRIDGVTKVQTPKEVVKEWIEYVHKTVYEEVNVAYPTYSTVLVPKEVEYTYDYWYPAQVPTTVTKYSDNKYIYLKPVRLNPISGVTLEATDTQPDGTSITYEVGVPSPSGIAWYTLDSSNNYHQSFSTSADVLLFRARLQTSDSSATPSISQLKLSFKMEPASEMLVVTKPYTPPAFGILCANVWSSVDSDYYVDPSASVSVAVAKDELISYQEPANYTETFTGDGTTTTFTVANTPVFNGSETVTVDGVTKTRGTDYTIDYSAGEVVFTSAPGDGATIEISYSIAEVDLPVNEVLEGSVSASLDSGSGELETLYEYDDYYVDHENAKITLYKEFAGTLTINYLPLIVSGLNASDGTLPARLDTQKWTSVGDGTTTTFQLPYVPIMPISLVQINDQDLIEDVDFTVDYATGQITFDEPPPSGSMIEVIYTPNIRDQTLRLAIKCERDDSNSGVYIYTAEFAHRP